MATEASTATRAIASGTQLHAIGSVKTVVGLVKAIDANGIERILQTGDLVYPNDTIVTADGGNVIIQFENGGYLGLPPAAEIVLNDEVYNPETPQQAAADEAARIQRAIEAGIDPAVAAQAAAAGGPGRDEGASVPLVIDFNNTTGNVDSGFPTTPLVAALPPILESTLFPNIADLAAPPIRPPANSPPTDESENLNTAENTPISGNVLSNASDPDGDTLSVTQFTLAGSPTVHAAGEAVAISGIGTLVINSDGSFTFTPISGFTGSMPAATYVVSDGRDGTTSSTLDITVTPPPDLTALSLAISTEPLHVDGVRNLIVNGSFEDISGITKDGQAVADRLIPSSGFVMMQSIAGWALDAGSPTLYMEPHNEAHASVRTPDGGGNNYMDLGASPGNIWISQSIAGLSDGADYALSFSFRDKAAMQEPGDAGKASGKVEVLWNGTVVATLDGDNTNGWNNFQADVVAKPGTNLLAFHEVGFSNDNWGIAIDNVQLYAAAHQGFQYSLTLTAGLESTSGGETLGPVLLAAASLPEGAVLKDGDTVLTATLVNGKSYYEVDLGGAGGSKQLTLESPTPLSSDALGALNGSVTAQDALNHKTSFLLGGSGNDVLVGGEGNDLLLGGNGNDALSGGGGSDTFAWQKGESGMDTITDFHKGSGGDVLKLSDLLDGAGPSNIADGGYLKFSYDEGSGSTKITIDTNGSASGGNTQVVVLDNVDLTAHNTLSTSTIIHNLLHDGNLKADA